MASWLALLAGSSFLRIFRCAAQEPCIDSTCSLLQGDERHAHALLQLRTNGTSKSVIGSERKRSIASELLPPELFELGLMTVGTEELLDEVVRNSREETVNYFGVQMKLRMVNGDLGNQTLSDEGKQLYGLDSLGVEQDKGMTMVDLGGNYGAVSIAAFKKYPNQLRGIVLEPVPSTYLFLRWNMLLNGVPALEESDLKDSSKTGVLALNRGIVTNQRDFIEVCYTPPYTMQGYICSCSDPSWSGKQCHRVKGETTDSLLEYFGSEPISLLKMDCEGCELSTLPVLGDIARRDPHRIRRLVGELHFPKRDLEDIACTFDAGKFFVRICSTESNPVEPMPLSCGENATPCGRDWKAQISMDTIENGLHNR